MKWFSEVTIRSKITLIAIAGVLGFACYFVYATYISAITVNKITQIRDVNYPVLHSIDSIWVPLHKIQQTITEAIHEKDVDIIQDANAQIDYIHQTLDEINALDSNTAANIQKLTRLFNHYFLTASHIIENMTETSVIGRFNSEVIKMQRYYTQFTEELSILKALQRTTFSTTLDNTTQQIHRFRNHGILFGLGILIGLLGFAILITRQIKRAIAYLIVVAEHIAKHNVDIDIQYTDKTEPGQVLASIETIRANLKDNKRWLNANAQLADSLNQTNIAKTLQHACNVIQEELNLLGVALYTTGIAGDLKLHYITTLAGSHSNDTAVSTNGLAMKVYQTNQQQKIIGPFNDHTLTISIGIGDIKPQVIIGWPINVNNECNGVLVTFSLTESTVSESHYIQQNTDRIGAKIHHYKLEQKNELLFDTLEIKSTELERVSEEALHANKMKNEFVATMSHELRTPMNGLLDIVQILKNTKLTPQQTQYLDTIRLSGKTLTNIINDMLDLSAIEAGEFELEAIEFDLERTLCNVCHLMSKSAVDKGLEFTFKYSPHCPRRLIGDEERIKQILINLIGNAIKFTAKGSVSIEIQLDHNVHDHNVHNNAIELIVVKINDSGIGISDDTRLSLAMSKHLVEKLTGQIGVNSTPDKGSTVWFTLALNQNQSAPSESLADLSKHRILVVDKLDLSRSVIFEQLRYLKAITEESTSIKEAVNKIDQATTSGCPFTMILCGEALADGIAPALASIVRENSNDIPLIVYLPAANNTLRDQCLRAGFTSHIEKPTYLHKLGHDIDGVIRQHEQEQQTQLDEDPVDTSDNTNPVTTLIANGVHGNILVVEDMDINQMVIGTLLSNMGMTVEFANHGEEAISRWKNKKYDLIFMDCQMPVMDGYQATTNIRQLERKTPSTTPIIALTANTESAERNKCTNAGMDDFLSKPFTEENIVQILNKWLDSNTIAAPESDDEHIDNADVGMDAEVSAKTNNLRILVVDDIDINQLVIGTMLNSMGLTVEFANNGQEAIDKWQQTQYDLILMDCQMPILDGYEATKKIRALEDNTDNHTPIVALTANIAEKDREKCTTHGMDDFLPKPFTEDAISETLSQWTEFVYKKAK